MTDSAVTPERIAELHKIVEQHVRAIGPGGEKAWLAGQLAAAAHGLLAHIKVLTDELAAKTEVAKSNKRVVESYAEEVERVTRERDEALALADHRAELLEKISGELSACVLLRGQARTVVSLAETVIRMSEPGFEDQASVRAGEIVRIFATKPGGNTPIESPALDVALREAQAAAARYHRCSGCGAIGPLRHEGSSYICADCNSAPESPAAPSVDGEPERCFCDHSVPDGPFPGAVELHPDADCPVHGEHAPAQPTTSED